MLWASIILFAVAAIGGSTLATLRIANRPLPLWLCLTHGLLTAAALVLFLAALLVNVATTATDVAALLLFLVAIIGGEVMFSLHSSGDPSGDSIPLPLVLGHGLLAAVAFILLLIRAIG